MIRNVGGCEALTPGHKSQRAGGRLGWASAPSAEKTPWILLRSPQGGQPPCCRDTRPGPGEVLTVDPTCSRGSRSPRRSS